MNVLVRGVVDDPKPELPAVLEPVSLADGVSSGSIMINMEQRIPVRLCNITASSRPLSRGVCLGVLIEAYPHAQEKGERAYTVPVKAQFYAKGGDSVLQDPKGAFTPDANEVLRANDLHVKSMQRRNRQSCGLRIECLGHLTHDSRKLKNLNFDGYSCRVNQSGACSSSDMITSGGRKSKTTMEDKLIVVVCGYLELYDTTLYFYKNRNKFCNEAGAAWQKPLP